MSANLEDAIQEKVHSLPVEQQQQVLAFVENLEHARHEDSGGFLSPPGNGKPTEVDLRALGISPEQAADLRTRLTTFEDWNDPRMDIYDVD